MNDTVIKGGKVAVFVAGFFLLFKMRPYLFWEEFFLNNYFSAIVTIILGAIFFVNKKTMSRTDKWLMLMFFFIIVAYPFVGDQNFNVFISIFPLLFIPFATDAFNKKVFDNYLNIYCFLIGISLFVWVLAILGAISPMKVIKPLNELKDYNYYVYPLLVRDTDDGIRFCGLFDEPGVVGTISGIFMCCQRQFRSWQSVILLLSGICSLSLFFFLIAIGYFIYNRLSVKFNAKNVLVFVIVSSIALVVVFSSPILSEMIVSRLIWDSDAGSFAGDNRSSALAWELLDQIKGTRQFWLGIDDKWGFHEKVAFSSSFINVVIMNGALFFGLIILFYIMYGLIYKLTLRGFFFFSFVLVATIYQRPYIFNPEFIFLWIFLARKESIYNRKRLSLGMNPIISHIMKPN